jgi:hypothetical protein
MTSPDVGVIPVVVTMAVEPLALLFFWTSV